MFLISDLETARMDGRALAQAVSDLFRTPTGARRSVNAAMVAKTGLVVVRSKGLSGQIGQHGITVSCVQPGLIDTAQILRMDPGDERAKFASA